MESVLVVVQLVTLIAYVDIRLDKNCYFKRLFTPDAKERNT